MIKLLVWVMIAAATAAAVLLKKSQNRKKGALIAAGILFGSMLALLMQSGYGWHMSLLVIIAFSLVTALLYMKNEEREQAQREHLKEERHEAKRQAQENAQKAQEKAQQAQQQQVKRAEPEPVTAQEPSSSKSESVFGMESIIPLGKGN